MVETTQNDPRMGRRESGLSALSILGEGGRRNPPSPRARSLWAQ